MEKEKNRVELAGEKPYPILYPSTTPARGDLISVSRHSGKTTTFSQAPRVALPGKFSHSPFSIIMVWGCFRLGFQSIKVDNPFCVD